MATRARSNSKRRAVRVPVRDALGEAVDDILVPGALRTVPGAPIDRPAARRYAREEPETSFWATDVYRLGVALRRTIKPEHGETTAEQFTSEIVRIKRAIVDYENLAVAEPRDPSPDLTLAIRRRAHELGFTMLGFTRFDRMWLNVESRREARFKHAIVGMLEQPWEITQKMASVDSFTGYVETQLEASRKGIALADFVRSLGYPVQFNYVTFTGRNMAPVHPYAVQAGMGQMGANGQLLTPVGSRCRFVMMSTDAPVTYDRPVDYGVNELCGKCLVCVRRCPGRALPTQQVWWRGVYKYKTNADRCIPMPTQYNGCGICMKVCPVQRYGLKAVVEHFGATGTVKGKDTDELEGYNLGSKGYWPAGRMPRFTVAEGGHGLMAQAAATGLSTDDLGTWEEAGSILMANPDGGRGEQ